MPSPRTTLLAMATLLMAGCHLVFPFEGQPAEPADSAVDQAMDAPGTDAPDSIDGLTALDQGQDQTGDVSSPDAPLLTDTSSTPDAPAGDAGIPADTAPIPDLPWPPDAAMADTTPSPDLPWPPDSAPAPDGPPPPTGVLWAQGFGGTSTDTGTAVAVDPNGNIYLTGSFAGTVDFGCGSSLTSAGEDIFLASYSPGGACRWAQRFGGTISDYGEAVAVDPAGNVSIAGSFMSASVDFGGGPLSNSHPGGGTHDLFVASFTSSGGFRWARAAGYSNAGEYAYGITADLAGNVTVTGVFTNTMDLGCGNLKTNGSSADMFLASFDGAGTCRWNANYGNTLQADSGLAIASDASGNLYVTGLFSNVASLGGPNLTSNGLTDVFLASYTSGGAYRWANGFGGTGPDSGYGVAVDTNGNVFLTGTFVNSADFGGGPLSSAGSQDVFLASYSASNGTHRWAQSLGGTTGDIGYAVTVDSSGNAFFIGRFDGSATWGTNALVSAGFSDIFVVSTTSAGAPRWAKRIGGAGGDFGYGAAVSSAGLVITGTFWSSPLDMGVTVLNNAGAYDILLATVAP